jgi:hypothetical protein
MLAVCTIDDSVPPGGTGVGKVQRLFLINQTRFVQIGHDDHPHWVQVAPESMLSRTEPKPPLTQEWAIHDRLERDRAPWQQLSRTIQKLVSQVLRKRNKRIHLYRKDQSSREEPEDSSGGLSGRRETVGRATECTTPHGGIPS